MSQIITSYINMAEAFKFRLLNSESSPIIISAVEIPLTAGHGCFKTRVTEWSADSLAIIALFICFSLAVLFSARHAVSHR